MDLDDVRRAILTAGLDVASVALPPPAPRPLTDDEVADIVHWAAQERLDGLAWLALAGPDSPWPLTETQRAALLECHLGGLRATVAAEAAAVWAVETLDRAGVRSWLLKGLASGHLDYPDPAMRTSFDADLLVARRDLGTALDALLAAGCRRRTPPLRGWWERRYARAIELVSPDGVEIDLHAAIADGAFGVTFDHDALRRDSGWVELAGRRCGVLSPAGRLVAASVALVLTRGPNLRLARDIVQLTAADEASIRAGRHLAGAHQAAIDDALASSGRLLGLPARGEGSAPPSRTPEPSSWSGDAVGAWRAMSWMARPGFVIGIAWPGRANLAARGLTRRDHVAQLKRRGRAVRDSSTST
jgi:hypothetical protein